MTTGRATRDEASESEPTGSETTASEPTTYRVRLDRGACEGVFACLVRDDRFVEAADGVATIDDVDPDAFEARAGSEELSATFADNRIVDARQAARACPVNAIDVTETDARVGATEGSRE